MAARVDTSQAENDPGLADFVLLITIPPLVAFLETGAKQLQPMEPAVVMGFGGIGPGAVEPAPLPQPPHSPCPSA
jgi:hypothetical protein